MATATQDDQILEASVAASCMGIDVRHLTIENVSGEQVLLAIRVHAMAQRFAEQLPLYRFCDVTRVGHNLPICGRLSGSILEVPRPSLEI